MLGVVKLTWMPRKVPYSVLGLTIDKTRSIR